MSPCHNLEPLLVARDSSRLISVKPNQWTHLSPFYTHMHGEWLRYAKSTSQFHWRHWRHDIMSPFPPSRNGSYVHNLDDSLFSITLDTVAPLCLRKIKEKSPTP